MFVGGGPVSGFALRACALDFSFPLLVNLMGCQARVLRHGAGALWVTVWGPVSGLTLCPFRWV